MDKLEQTGLGLRQFPTGPFGLIVNAEVVLLSAARMLTGHVLPNAVPAMLGQFAEGSEQSEAHAWPQNPLYVLVTLSLFCMFMSLFFSTDLQMFYL